MPANISTLSNMWKLIRPNCLQLNNVNPRINWQFNRKRHRMTKLTSELGLPDRPKRPLNPYFKFSSEQRPALKVQNPQMTVIEMTKKLGELWKTYDPVKKERMKEIYKSEVEIYTRDIMSYYRSLTLEQQNMVKDYRDNLRKKKVHKQLRQTYKELGKPKRPIGPFVIYAHKYAGKKDAGTLYKDWLKHQAENWQKLSDKDKEPYHIEYLKTKEQFKLDVIKWETKMIEMGNTHLVRKSVLRDLQGQNIEEIAAVETSKDNQFNKSEKSKNDIEKVVDNSLIKNEKKMKKIKQSKAAVELNKVDELVDDIKSINIEDQPTIDNDQLANDEKLINKTDKVVKDPLTINSGQLEPIDTSKEVANELIDEEKSINNKNQPTIINDQLVNDEKLINKTDKVVKDPLTINPGQFKPIDTSKKVVELNKVDDEIINKVDESIKENKVPKKLENKTLHNVENPINKTDELIEESTNNNKTKSSLWSWWK